MSDEITAEPVEPSAAPVDGAVGGVLADGRRVMDALSNVIDPELGLDFVELGLIYGVEVDAATST